MAATTNESRISIRRGASCLRARHEFIMEERGANAVPARSRSTGRGVDSDQAGSPDSGAQKKVPPRRRRIPTRGRIVRLESCCRSSPARRAGHTRGPEGHPQHPPPRTVQPPGRRQEDRPHTPPLSTSALTTGGLDTDCHDPYSACGSARSIRSFPNPLTGGAAGKTPRTPVTSGSYGLVALNFSAVFFFAEVKFEVQHGPALLSSCTVRLGSTLKS